MNLETTDLDHDLCGSCYNLPESDPVKVEKRKHTRPCVMKATLLMPNGRRQWLGLEGKLALEEERHASSTQERREPTTVSESNLSPDPQGDSSDSEISDASQSPDASQFLDISQSPDSEPIRKERICGRCSESISFDSTYYKCLGHSCHGASNTS